MLGPEPNPETPDSPATMTRAQRLAERGHRIPGASPSDNVAAIQAQLNEQTTPFPENVKLPPGWTLVPPAPEKPPGVFRRKVPDRALILKRGGPVDISKVSTRRTPTPSGEYVSETDGRFWLPKGLKPGWIRVYTENNPAPITYREPLGYFAEDLPGLGITLPTQVGAGFQAPKVPFGLPGWVGWVLIGVAGVGGIVAWLWYRGVIPW